MPTRRPASLARELAELLEHRILSGQIPPGSKLPSEPQLCASHQLSRSVVREALSQLQARGRVTTRHGVGTFACDPPQALAPLPPASSAGDIVSIMELRISIESEAAALAAQRRTEPQLATLSSLAEQLAQNTALGRPSQELDQKFHLALTQATANPYLIHILSSLADSLIPRMRLQASYAASGHSPAFLQKRDAEHEEILRAIARRDPVAASAAMRVHLCNSRERLLQIFQPTP
ncbi:MAG: hypothetical protein RLZZ142_1144 [Verrucomicrobiota bacterium]